MQLEDLQVVLKVAECRSITAAAVSLDLRTGTASAAVKRVEAALGAELFIRTTRQLRLSKAGERYLPQCEQALRLLAQARQTMREELDVVDGELRLALSSDLGRNRVASWLDAVMAEHPNLSLRAHFSDSKVDFYRDGVDMALRYGAPNDASLYGFKLCDVPRLLCASPDYLEAHGTPTTPEQLASHNGLLYQLYDRLNDLWEFQHGGSTHRVRMRSNRAANDGDLVRRWCVAGHGLAVKSCLDLAEDLLAGRLVPLMPDYRPKGTELWLVFPSRHSITPAARLLRDAFQARCQQTLAQLKARNLLPD
ncbi:LysR family transcriptional regulator [Ferrimonas balearica]|uniref:LysR family transcriptional regulator n=1 Tax=Ferrimonas balearica TaxID=44012 RepID=UPI001C998931|nr:LysR family transcriptional regulator [Ferrimonas balearica]MBY5993652.1 LysR family transcriptional regulator [Ferrimonas balearica]